MLRPMVLMVLFCIVVFTTAFHWYAVPTNELSPMAAQALQSVETGATIKVDATELNSVVQTKQGFLHGFPFSGLPANRVKDLQPKFWRESDLTKIDYLRAHFDLKITFGIIEWYTNLKHLDWTAIDWTKWDWNDYESNLRVLVSQGAVKVDYWDIWPEPDWSFTGTTNDLEQVYIRTHNIIRSILPQAKIIGPDLSKFDPQLLKEFLELVTKNSLRFDALSWHENGVNNEKPHDFSSHITQIKSLCSPNCPEFHINEYLSPETHLVPGWNLAWLNAFEANNVNVVSRACWNTSDGVGARYNDCFEGLNGIFTRDFSTPKIPYWVHYYFARLDGGAHLKTTYPVQLGEIWLSAISAKVNNEIRILLGTYSCGQDRKWCSGVGYATDATKYAAINFDLAITNLRASQVNIEITKLANDDAKNGIGVPTVLINKDYRVTNGVVVVPLNDVGDGDVLSIIARNESETIIGPLISDTTPPSIPTNLTTSAFSITQINLSWIPSTDNVGVAGYRIYRNGTQLTTVTTSSYSNTGLSPSTSYTYTVAAYDAAGNTSSQSTSASGSTQSASVTTTNTATTNTTNTSTGSISSVPSATATATTGARATTTPITTSPLTTPTTKPTPFLSLTRTLYLGSKNEEVKSLQQLLISKDFLPEGTTTGFYGPLTKQAVQKYQCAQNIVCSGTEASTGYGVVGLKTRAKLNGTGTTRPTPYVSTSTLTLAQADSIIALIQSFGADAEVVARVRAVLGR